MKSKYGVYDENLICLFEGNKTDCNIFADSHLAKEFCFVSKITKTKILNCFEETYLNIQYFNEVF